MLASEFKHRFVLQPTVSATPITLSDNAKVRQSAVLVPVIDYGSHLSLLFTERSWQLPHHPGQVSFPGGKLEPGENSMMAALRETEEEIGIKAKDIQLLGQLSSHNTLTGFHISPWVGLIASSVKITPQPAEVNAVFDVPLPFLFNPQHRHQLWLPWHGQLRQLHFMPYRQRLIWGATAAIVDQLLRQLG